MDEKVSHTQRIRELETLLEQAERKSDILTNLLKEASAEFKQALEKVTTSERNFRAIFENAPEAIFIFDIQSQRILDCNPFTCNWLEYSREEVLSMRVRDIFASGIREISENIQKAILEGGVHNQESRFRKKGGSIVDAEISGTLIDYQGQKCYTALVRDITERKQVEELTRYKALFANVNDPVFINDFNGLFLEANDVACSCFGYSHRILLQKRLGDLVVPEQRRVLQQVNLRIPKERELQFELGIVTKNGKSIPFEFNSKLIQFKGYASVLSVARNLSLRKQIEETLVRTERLKAVGEMASGVAHNFNNLLQMILGSGEAALAKLDAGRVRQCRDAIQNILTACRRGTGIVRRIKDFTLSRTDRMKEEHVFDLEELLMEAMELTRPLWKDISTPQKYRVNIVKCGECYVRGKTTEIYEVLVNMIKNAIEAMPGGGALTVATRVSNEKVFLSISDTGYGIAEEDFQRIFEPFFSTKGSKSSGLGLSSSYGIVKRHHGEIHVVSDPGEGTTFTLIFPLCKQSEKKVDIQALHGHNSKIKLLIIDDEVNILKAMEMFFEDSSVEIYTARTAQEGIEAIKEKCFDVILCDFGMDEINGLEISKSAMEYARRVKRKKIPFLLYTGLDKKLNAAELEQNGVDLVVNKPVSLEKLSVMIQTMVRE